MDESRICRIPTIATKFPNHCLQRAEELGLGIAQKVKDRGEGI